MSHARYAIYYLPPNGPLAEFGARWLGWDALGGAEAAMFDVPGLAEATDTPRKYGFHGTLKPPFRLAGGLDAAALSNAVADLAARTAPAQADGLSLTRLGRFLALTPTGDTTGIARVARAAVAELDAFRAPAGEAELDRRRQAGLSTAQEANLMRWGYPYVMDEFRFHMTLTGRLPKAEIADWEQKLAAHLPPLPAPFKLDEIALVGERPDGRFELIERHALRGQVTFPKTD